MSSGSLGRDRPGGSKQSLASNPYRSPGTPQWVARFQKQGWSVGDRTCSLGLSVSDIARRFRAYSRRTGQRASSCSSGSIRAHAWVSSLRSDAGVSRRSRASSPAPFAMSPVSAWREAHMKTPTLLVFSAAILFFSAAAANAQTKSDQRSANIAEATFKSLDRNRDS